MIFLTFDTQDECDKFIDLFENYKKTIYYTIKRFISDEHTIEDISQEIYIIIAKHLDDIDMNQTKRTRNYIITITRNYCKNFLRNNSKYTEAPLSDVVYDFSAKDEILSNVVLQEQVDHLIREIKNLDEKYKCVLELKYINEFTDTEIAEFLNISKKNVQMRLYRAKIMLRKKLGEYSNEQYPQK